MDERSRRFGSARRTISPPRPPSPPSGPPFGTCFSRRKWRLPSPPRPACTWMRARSWNTECLLRAVDFDEALLAALAEHDRSRTLREDRVVATEAGAVSRAELRAALPDQDHPGLDLLAGEDLHAEHLRVRIAAVARGAESLLVCHLLLLLFRCQRGLERRDCTLPVCVRAFVFERRLELLGPPPLRLLLDVRDRVVRVALRRRCRGLLCSGRTLGRRRLPLTPLRHRADRLDLDLRPPRAEPGVAAVPSLRAVLADPDLLAERVSDDARRHLRLRRKRPPAVAADEEHTRLERLALLGTHAVDEQPLALADDILLAA